MSSARAAYRRFVVGMLLGECSYFIQTVAIAWHIYTLDHRPLDLGLIGLALFIPTLLLAVPAGVVADRVDRRAVVVITTVAEALLVCVFVLAVVLHIRQLAVYYGVLIGIGAARATCGPAERSLLVNIVERDFYMQAQAQYRAYRELLRIGAPAVGGVFVAISVAFALCAAAVMLVLSAACLATVRMRPRERNDTESVPGWRDGFDGLRFILAHPVVAGAISMDLFAVLFGGATALLPAFAADVFHAGPVGLGLLRSAPACGAALVAAYLARRPPERHVGRTLLWTVAGFGVATIIFGVTHSFVVALGALAATGGTDIVSVVIRSSLVQLTTPDALRGRVSAFENIFIGASNELGAFESGMVAAWIGVVPSVVAGGVGTLAVIAIWSAVFPALRRADRFVEEGAHGDCARTLAEC